MGCIRLPCKSGAAAAAEEATTVPTVQAAAAEVAVHMLDLIHIQSPQEIHITTSWEVVVQPVIVMTDPVGLVEIPGL
jgi:hypothetical protein